MNEEERIELRSEEFQEILGSVPHWILRWGITVLAAVLLLLLTGSALIKYPDAIPAQVLLTGSVPPAVVAAHASGKLNELFVADNQDVKAGDYLAVIDNSARTEDIRFLKNYLDSLTNDSDRFSDDWWPESGNGLSIPALRLGNLQLLYSSFSNALFDYLEYKRLMYYSQKIAFTKERIVQYEKQYRNLLNQQQILSEQNELTKKQYYRDSSLYKTGYISIEEFEKAQNQYLQSQLSDETMRSSLRNMQIQITQLKELLLDTGQQDTERLNNLQSQLRSYILQLKTELRAWELNYALIAPVDGKITFTNYWTVNQNVNGGEEVFTIIPNRYEVIGKALLPVMRSGKVKPGQKVNIRLENFPDNEYGILRGKVENISLVPSQTNQTLNYTVEISFPKGLTTTYQKELPFLPNMRGQAEIITEDISLLERFIFPLKRIITESL